MNRRNFLKISIPAALFLNSPAFSFDKSKNIYFEHFINKSTQNNWQALPIGDLVSKTGMEFLDTPYEAHTLEGPGPEKLRCKFTGLDCVTFYETVLAIARIIKKGENTIADFENELKFIRYRSGKIDNYTSRLHYTSQWIFYNEKKGVVEDVTKSLGGKPHKFNLNFMSNHPQYYEKLKNNPDFVQTMRRYEKEISEHEFYIIPQREIAAIQNKIQSGDIIAISSTITGLDYAHTGLAYNPGKSGAKLLHASSAKKKVILDKDISSYVLSNSKQSGISVLRPLPV